MLMFFTTYQLTIIIVTKRPTITIFHKSFCPTTITQSLVPVPLNKPMNNCPSSSAHTTHVTFNPNHIYYHKSLAHSRHKHFPARHHPGPGSIAPNNNNKCSYFPPLSTSATYHYGTPPPLLSPVCVIIGHKNSNRNPTPRNNIKFLVYYHHQGTNNPTTPTRYMNM